MCLLMAETNLLNWLYGKRGSGSSRKNSFSAPVMTWTSSHWPSSRSSSSAWTQHMHLSLARSRGQCCLQCEAAPTYTFILHPKMGCGFYRDQPCSVASEWQRGFRSLCKVHRCPNLKKITQKCFISQSKRIHVTHVFMLFVCQAESTSFFHRFDAFFHKTWDRGLLLCTECGQMAAKHIVCEEKGQNYEE